MTDRKSFEKQQFEHKPGGELCFYWQHYGLMQDPFPALYSSDLYFSLPKLEHHLDLLQHLIKNENVLLAVIGGEGYGKTVFANQLQQSFDDCYYIHKFEADSLFSTRKLVRELENGFGLKAPLNTAPEEQLDAQIAEVQHKDRTCLLVIDDAHFLPLETLNSLLFLLKQQSRNQMRLHIVLLGDKNLQTKLVNLAKYELSGDIIHSVELEPLSLEETKQYLIHRMNKAGLQAEMPLDRMSIEKIYGISNGVLGKVNYAAQQILLENIVKTKKTDKSKVLKKHQTKIIGGCLLIVALIAASYVLDRQGQYSSAKQQGVIAFANENQTITPPVAKQRVANQSDANSMPSTKVNNQPLPNQTPSAVKPNKAVASAKAKKIAAVVEPSKLPEVYFKAKPVITHHAKKKLKPHHVKLAQLETISVVPEQKPYHVDVIKHPNLAKTYRDKVVGTQKATSKHVVHKKQLHIRHENKFKLTKADKQLLKENSNDYTLQVIGLSYENSMLRFIKENHLSSKAHYVATKLHGKPWFILLYGTYKTPQEATKAIKTLPKVLVKYKPWPRQLKFVKVDIERG